MTIDDLEAEIGLLKSQQAMLRRALILADRAMRIGGRGDTDAAIKAIAYALKATSE